MATFTNVQLGKGGLTNSLATLYTSTAVKTIVSALTFCNTNTTTARAVTVKYGPSGSTRHILSAYPVSANGILTIEIPHVLAASDIIEAKQDTGTDVDWFGSGITVA